MIGNKIGKRYADAIYQVAEKRNRVVEIYEVLNDVMVLYKKNPDFKMLITHPLIDVNEKERFLNDFLSKNGSEITKEDIEIVDYILEKNRIEFIRNIVVEYVKIYYEKNRILKVEAIFAKEPTEEQKNKLIANITKKTGKEINLRVKIDEGIIGGGIIKIDDKIIDGSIKKELESIRKKSETLKQGVQG